MGLNYGDAEREGPGGRRKMGGSGFGFGKGRGRGKGGGWGKGKRGAAVLGGRVSVDSMKLKYEEGWDAEAVSVRVVVGVASLWLWLWLSLSSLLLRGVFAAAEERSRRCRCNLIERRRMRLCDGDRRRWVVGLVTHVFEGAKGYVLYTAVGGNGGVGRRGCSLADIRFVHCRARVSCRLDVGIPLLGFGSHGCRSPHPRRCFVCSFRLRVFRLCSPIATATLAFQRSRTQRKLFGYT